MEKNDQNQGNNSPQEEVMDAGLAAYSWETWEFLPHLRSKRWYIVAGIITALLIVYSLWTANFMFAIIVLMIAVIFLALDLRKPARIQVHITDLGIVVDDKFYSFEEVKDFSVIYAPPEIKWLYVSFQKGWLPMLTIPLEDADPILVREALLPYCIENIERSEESLTDMMRRLYKL